MVSDPDGYNSSDSVDLGGGTDRADLITDGTNIRGTFTNVENFFIEDTNGDTFDAGKTTGAAQIWTSGSSADLTVTDVQNNVIIGLRDTDQGISVTFADDALGSDEAKLSVALDEATRATGNDDVVIGGGGDDLVTTLEIAVSSDSEMELNEGAGNILAIETITVTGDGALELTEDGGEFDDVTTITANAGGLDITLGAGNSEDVTFTGGAGDDRIAFADGEFTADDTVDGGDGDGDVLAIGGDDAANATEDNVSNVETIELTAVTTGAVDFDGDALGVTTLALAADVTDGGDFTIQNFSGNTVQIGSDLGTSNLIVQSQSGSDVINFTTDEAGDTYTVAGLQLDSIETVNVTVADGDTLELSDVGLDSVDTLKVSGEGDIDIDGATLTTGAALETLDLSELEGTFDNDGVELNADIDDILIGNVGAGSIIEIDNGTSNTFTFGASFDNDVTIDVGTSDTAATGEGFDTGVGGDILDLSALGVANFSDLTLTQNGGNTDITSDVFDGTITLVGVIVGDLDGAANFVFA